MWACFLDRMNWIGMINTTASCGRFADHTCFQGRRSLGEIACGLKIGECEVIISPLLQGTGKERLKDEAGVSKALAHQTWKTLGGN